MDTARTLFEKLKTFKEVDASGNSPEYQLLEYCKNVLGSVEKIHFDYKTKHNRSYPKLDDDDKKNLAKAVSGFANTGGGVLIWGLENETLKPKPITDIHAFLANLLGLSPLATDPVVGGIDGDWIPSDNGSTEGYALVLIPESLLPPHRVTQNGDNKDKYYIRSGSDFLVAPHVVLEDMFGRRPKPVLSLSISYYNPGSSGSLRDLNVILGIENQGRGTAKSPFLSIKVHPPYEISPYGIDGGKNWGLEKIVRTGGQKEVKYGSMANKVIHPGIILDVTAVLVNVDFSKSSSYVTDLKIDYQIAAEGVEIVKNEITIDGETLWKNAQMQL